MNTTDCCLLQSKRFKDHESRVWVDWKHEGVSRGGGCADRVVMVRLQRTESEIVSAARLISTQQAIVLVRHTTSMRARAHSALVH